MDDSDVGCRSVAQKCQAQAVGGEEFVSVFTRFGVGEGEYHEYGNNTESG